MPPSPPSELYALKAKAFLTHISTIRFFTTDGPGYGDQVFSIHLIRNLRNMGYTGKIELICNNHFKIRYKTYTSQGIPLVPAKMDQLLGKLPMGKMADLLGIDLLSPDMSIDRTINTFETGAIRLRDWKTFKKSTQPEVDLAIFAGFSGYVTSNYGVFGGWTQLSANQLAHSGRALLLDPFTENPYGFLRKSPGFMIQMPGQAYQTYFEEKKLPYLVFPSSVQAIEEELIKLDTSKPALVETINRLLYADNLHRFTIYGLDTHERFPQNRLLSLITAGTIHHRRLSAAPLVVILLNPFNNKTMDALQNYFSAPEKLKISPAFKYALQTLNGSVGFLDSGTTAAMMTQTILPATLKNNTTYILSLPALSYPIVNQLLLESNYPPVYQGANTGNLLRTANKTGLLCNRMLRSAWDLYLPPIARDAAFCKGVSRDFYNYENIVTLIEGLNNTAWVPAQEPDRLTYALATISQQPRCNESSTLHCAFFSGRSFNPWPHRVLAFEETALLGGVYGASIAVMARIFHNVFNVQRSLAPVLARFVAANFLFAYQQNGPAILNFQFSAILVVTTIMPMLVKNTNNDTHILSTILMMGTMLMGFVNELQDYDAETLLFVVFLTAVSAVSNMLGYQITDEIMNYAEKSVQAQPMRKYR